MAVNLNYRHLTTLFCSCFIQYIACVQTKSARRLFNLVLERSVTALIMPRNVYVDDIFHAGHLGISRELQVLVK